MKYLAPGKVRARTIVERGMLEKLRVIAAEAGLATYGPLVATAIDAVNAGGRVPAASSAPERADEAPVEFALDEKAWHDLRITAAQEGRSRQGLLRDLIAVIAAD